MKLIILSPCIIRGDFHKKSLGKFYYTFSEHTKEFEIYHIFNIDSPVHLKTFFTPYETVGILQEIIPNYVNKIFIWNDNAGFLNAFKNLMKKTKELQTSEDNIYWWLEDDWEVINNYDIFKVIKLFCSIKNTAINFTQNSPLGSFRAGPIMSNQYFINYFNIEKIMNQTCDPERQVSRWLSGMNRSNGRKKIHRSIVNNDEIHIFSLYFDKSNINFSDLHMWHYDKSFNKEIKFKYYILIYNTNVEIANVDNINNSSLNFREFDPNEFNNQYIKYITVHPYVFSDIGRYFNLEFNLTKWNSPNDSTTYKNVNLINVQFGNPNNLNIDDLRLNPNETLNTDFVKTFYDILTKLPCLDDKHIKPNLIYYSHKYGTYPNFNVFGKVIKLNYVPDVGKSEINISELPSSDKHVDIYKYFKFDIQDICKKEVRPNYYEDIIININLIKLCSNNDDKVKYELKLKELCNKNQEHLEDVISNTLFTMKNMS